VCYNIPSGELVIKYHAGFCPGFAKGGYANTGYGISFHIFVEELLLDGKRSCTSKTPVTCE